MTNARLRRIDKAAAAAYCSFRAPSNPAIHGNVTLSRVATIERHEKSLKAHGYSCDNVDDDSTHFSFFERPSPICPADNFQLRIFHAVAVGQSICPSRDNIIRFVKMRRARATVVVEN